MKDLRSQFSLVIDIVGSKSQTIFISLSFIYFVFIIFMPFLWTLWIH